MTTNPKNILVFPCGSEIALEIHSALQFEKYINLYGASSVNCNHGRYVYREYFDGIPSIEDDRFLVCFNKLLGELKIDAVFPAYDSVLQYLAQHESAVHAKLLGSSFKTNKICRSKSKTYSSLDRVVRVPRAFTLDDISEVDLPVFMKPDQGQGSQGVKLVKSIEEVHIIMRDNPDYLILEYLPGREFTVDCFTNSCRELLYAVGRERCRIKSGISVNTRVCGNPEFRQWAKKINSKIHFRGAWFFQVKENAYGDLVLLEVAPRIAGTSALARARGVNLPLLTIYDAFDVPVAIQESPFVSQIDRGFESRFFLECSFNLVYVDYDDCFVVNGQLNSDLIKFLVDCLNEKIQIILLTRHARDIHSSLEKFGLSGFFHEIIHIQDGSPKSLHIDTSRKSIFIDDSFAERREVHEQLGIPVFSPDTINCLGVR